MNPRAKDMYMMCTRKIVRAVDLIMVVFDDVEDDDDIILLLML